MATKPIDPVKTCSDHASKAPEDCCKQTARKTVKAGSKEDGQM